MLSPVSNLLRRLAMKAEWTKSVIRQAGQAIYEADLTLQPFDHLPERGEDGILPTAQAAL